jgi:hypothetical protein
MKPNKRPPHSSAPTGGFSFDDVTLARTCLALPLGDTLRAGVLSLVDGLVVGRFGQLPRGLRDRLFQLAASAGVLPKGSKSAREKRDPTAKRTGQYTSHRSAGTAKAEELLASYSKIPIPPPLRSDR